MSYKLVRVIVCDNPTCENPENARVVQGEDVDAKDIGWFELTRVGKPKMHLCPACFTVGAQLPT